MATVELELSPYKNKKGLQAILLRVQANNRCTRKATGISVDEKQWDNAKRKVKRTHSLAVEHNAMLAAKVQEAERAISIQLKDARVVDTKKVAKAVYGTQSLKKLLDDYAVKQQPRRRVRFEYIGRLVEQFSPKMQAEMVTPEWIESFRAYLKKPKSPDESVPVHNTIVGILNKLRTAYRAAKLNVSDPFKEMTVGGYRPSADEPLTIEQVKVLMDYEPRGKWQRIAKDAWLFSFFASGLRSADVLTLEWSALSNGRIVIEPGKTQDNTGVRLSIPIYQPLQEILDRQNKGSSTIFGVAHKGMGYKELESVQAAIGSACKAIALKAGLPANFKFKLARTTFAHISQKATGDIYATQKAMGHSKVATTEIYLALETVDTEAATSAVAGLF